MEERRRFDRLAAVTYALWFVVGMVYTFLHLPSATHSVRPGTSNPLASALVLLVLTFLLKANAFFGVLWGRPWGFRWMAFLNALSAASPFLNSLRPHSTAPPYPTTVFGVFNVLVNLALLVYCVLRLTQKEPSAES